MRFLIFIINYYFKFILRNLINLSVRYMGVRFRIMRIGVGFLVMEWLIFRYLIVYVLLLLNEIFFMFLNVFIIIIWGV